MPTKELRKRKPSIEPSTPLKNCKTLCTSKECTIEGNCVYGFKGKDENPSH